MKSDMIPSIKGETMEQKLNRHERMLSKCRINCNDLERENNQLRAKIRGLESEIAWDNEWNYSEWSRNDDGQMKG